MFNPTITETVKMKYFQNLNAITQCSLKYIKTYTGSQCNEFCFKNIWIEYKKININNDLNDILPNIHWSNHISRYIVLFYKITQNNQLDLHIDWQYVRMWL